MPALRVDVAGLQTLELDAIEKESPATLIARGAAYVREYVAIEDKPTILAMNIATVLLALRKKHGDWLGRSYEYRQDVNEVYRQANIPPDRLTRTQATVRYHVGNLLRRHLTPRELQKLELIDASPLERQQDRHSASRAIVRAVKATAEVTASTPAPKAKTAKGAKEETVPEQGGGVGTGVKATADHLRLAKVVGNVLEQLSPNVIKEHMTDGQRAKLDEELADLQKKITELRRLTKKPRSKG
ncbi:hypothetical protein [Streptomyces sp. NPDC005907]|uniref:hypothetical protein n=1 Tax=Streptomyces sp. NPDC005907 TaxID=3154571 RepID=UPI0033FDF1A8